MVKSTMSQFLQKKYETKENIDVEFLDGGCNSNLKAVPKQ